MDKHQQVMETVAEGLIRFDPLCSILVGGGVGRGECHPESDIDLFIVTWRLHEVSMCGVPHVPDAIDWENPERHRWVDEDGDPSWFVDDVLVQLNLRSPHDYQAEHMAWRTTCGNDKMLILYDPSGILKWGARCIARFAEDNPEIHSACTRFFQDYRIWKRNPEHPRPFKNKQDLLARIDTSGAIVSYESFTEERLTDLITS